MEIKMNTNGPVVREITEKYENNCLEVNLGRDLVWYKELNDKGEVTENLLMQEVDGGQRGVDIFGDEHFISCSFDKKTMTLLQADGEVKRYARDKRGMFRIADENFNIIEPQKVENYQPVVKNALQMAEQNAVTRGVVLQARERE